MCVCVYLYIYIYAYIYKMEHNIIYIYKMDAYIYIKNGTPKQPLKKLYQEMHLQTL